MAFQLQDSLSDDYQHICKSDPALDTAREDFEDLWQQYRDTGDQSLLPLKDGQTPSVFTLRHLSGHRIKGRLHHVAQEQGGLVAAQVACALALRGTDIKGLKIGRSELIRDEHYEIVKDEILDKLPYEVVIELGNVAIEKMNPSRD